ncbi:Transcriptional regulator, TetR family [Cystobacter fuscus DSM 2262]|uniref:Transcriptional regulator, TetR family n=1 Tax=Cystobacter fuscus (strain ATCC 25194 / DSM 2262 / NBRC 100088 / M29) TaxID=1242864 RepID=S9QQV5_CYSF2|nr:TetR family transcriptional regulator [Cystobacter fuscus]EPX58998.1 Transcriptional regulator, TetR family [Cystobacter fuscus DSM 2262]
MSPPGPRGTSQERGRQRRARLIEGVTHVLRTGGLQAVSARSVADAAEVPLAAVTYYFSSLEELIAETLAEMLRQWVEQVRGTTRLARAHPEKADLARWVTQAMLPPGGTGAIQAHYELLVACGRRAAFSAVLARGRADLDEALAELIVAALPGGTRPPSPQLVLAVLDGAVVSALSEGTPVDTTVQARLDELLRA